MDSILTTIVDTTFHNDNNSYSVLRTLYNDLIINVVGYLPEFIPNEQVTFFGEWIEHSVYGTQFKATSYKIETPNTLKGIEAFLSSGIIKGIRASTAKLIIDKFGENTFDVLDNTPIRLMEIKGIGEKRYNLIIESYYEIVGIRNILITLQNYGFSTAMSIKISKFYGENTIKILKTNPYILIEDIEGVGFLTADKIALQMGFSSDSSYRIQAAIQYCVQNNANVNGHTYLPHEILINECINLLNLSSAAIEIEINALILLNKLKQFKDEENNLCVAIPFYFNAENEIALRLKLLQTEFLNKKNINIYFDKKTLENNVIKLNNIQILAVKTALKNGVSVITGGPGTGKTTIIKTIVDLLKDYKTILCAPTGRAAKRMASATGIEAKTIHRLLEYTNNDLLFIKNEDDPLDAECIIVDESSMVDINLMIALLRAIVPGTILVLVGDVDQLPSIGAGNVLKDIINSGNIPSIRLQEIYRQEQDSQIIENSFKINNGEFPIFNLKNGDFFFEYQNNARNAATTIEKLISVRLPKYYGLNNNFDIINEIQVLSPTKQGECGVIELNKRIQNVLNPESEEKEEILYSDTIFRVGDKIIQNKNDYNVKYKDIITKEELSGVYNGDIGYIKSINDNSIKIIFDDSKEVIYGKGDLDNISHAYCLTVHKSQGSEFPIVIIPVVSGPKPLLVRNLLYTAVTRAKNMVVLVGKQEVVKLMIDNDYIAKRYTRLKSSLNECFQSLY